MHTLGVQADLSGVPGRSQESGFRLRGCRFLGRKPRIGEGVTCARGVATA